MVSLRSIRSPLVMALRLMLLLGLVTLAACGRSPGLPSGIGPAIKGDARPHEGVARARAMPIQGIDVARYQGNIDWDQVRRDGIHFAFIKGTEGKDYIDPNFDVNWRGAKAAGIAHGVYHFMTWCSLASQQANWFARMVPNDPDSLPPVLDVEWNNHSSCKNKHSREDILEKIRVMLDAMERHTGKLPIIYTDINFHRDILAGENFPNTFWLRSTAAEPHDRYQRRQWTFWQWTQTGHIAGIRPQVDRNAFFGDANDWQVFRLTGCDPRMIPALSPSGRCRMEK